MDRNRALRDADRNVFIGWATALAMLVARLLTVALQFSRGSIDVGDLGLAVFKSAVLILVVVFYRRHAWPAYLMLGAWPIGFVLAWWLAHAPPSVMAVGLLVGLGSFLGVRGVRAVRALRALDSVPRAAV